MNRPLRELLAASASLRDAVNTMKFTRPVAFVYNPLDYAWSAYEIYLRRYAASPKRVLFLGMNPGPFGMAQTGVPFGEVSAVRDWLGISAAINKPPREHPRRPVQGFLCPRSEVSGQRLWGLFAKKFSTPEKFFANHFVANYCPLVFMDANGRNITPDKLPSRKSAALLAACDEHLRKTVQALRPEWLIGVGGFASARAVAALGNDTVRVGQILHPSPASPAANRGWARQAERQLRELGVW